MSTGVKSWLSTAQPHLLVNESVLPCRSEVLIRFRHFPSQLFIPIKPPSFPFISSQHHTSTMDHEPPSVTAERKAKRQKRSIFSSSQSTVVPSTPPSISGIFSLKLPSSSAMGTPAQHVGPPETSTPRSAEVGMASTPIDSHNPRGIRSKASLDL